MNKQAVHPTRPRMWFFEEEACYYKEGCVPPIDLCDVCRMIFLKNGKAYGYILLKQRTSLSWLKNYYPSIDWSNVVDKQVARQYVHKLIDETPADEYDKVIIHGEYVLFKKDPYNRYVPVQQVSMKTVLQELNDLKRQVDSISTHIGFDKSMLDSNEDKADRCTSPKQDNDVKEPQMSTDDTD